MNTDTQHRAGAAGFAAFRLACVVFLVLAAVGAIATADLPHAIPADAAVGSFPLAPQHKAFLVELTARLFRYFNEHSNAETQMVDDRARADGSPYEPPIPASITATGFGLTAFSIAPDYGWLSHDEARERVRKSLRFLANRAPHVRGWFYHFVDPQTGARRFSSEVSSIDTALLLCGVLEARERFSEDSEIRHLANKIYERVDFQWMLNGDPYLLSHGWMPESGFIKYRWDTYSEHMVLYLLAIGSQRRPITAKSWYSWKRPTVTYAGYSYISGGPLFTHQYSQAWVDYRGRKEKEFPYTDYFGNSIAATRAHRAFCLNLSAEFPGYSSNVWGITASDSIRGYVAWGGPPRHPDIDGTVVPSAAGGSLMFAPDICLPALMAMHDRFGEKIYGRYGFVDAFNPNTGWVNPDVIGIDAGITLLSAANLIDGSVWRWFMRNPEILRALQMVGMEKTAGSQQSSVGSEDYRLTTAD
jgi:hypothetical protein